MRCIRVRKLLGEYADESLSISIEEQVRRHLSSCRECAMVAEDLRSMVALLHRLPRLETSPEFTSNLMRHLPVAVALSQRTYSREGFWAWISSRLPRIQSRRARVALVPVMVAIGLAVCWWSVPGIGRGVAPGRSAPVISQGAYLAAIAREHAGYASEHPLADASAVNLEVTIANASQKP